MKTAKTLLKVLLLATTLVLLGILWIYGQFPTDKEIRSCMVTTMYQVNLCPTEKNYAKLNQVSQYMQKAVVLTEDSAFWQHNGFDFAELEKSFKTNLEKGKFARGGSTITQQLAKNLFLSKEKTLSRKIKEAVITMRIEQVLTKKEILERYLNVVQFGKNLFGITEASRFYFSKHPSELDIVESAFLAFLLPSPEKYSKSFFKKELTPFARKRLNQIIDRLFEFHKISESEYFTGKNKLSQFLAGHKVEVEVPEEIELIDEESVEVEDY